MAGDSGAKSSPPSSGDGQPTAEYLRRRLRVALMRARSEAPPGDPDTTEPGVTQRYAADQLDWSVSKVVRIEQGTVPVTPTDVRAMLTLYGVSNDRIEELVQLARDSKEAKDLSEYHSVTSPTFRELVAHEQEADSIWKHEPSLVPGYFQTYDYMQHLLGNLGHSGANRDLRVELRQARQEIVEGEKGPAIHVVIGEAALLRPVGDTEVMREQIKRLISLSHQPRIKLSLLPLSAGAHPGVGDAFTVLQFLHIDDPDALFRYDAAERITSEEDPNAILRYLDLYNSLRERAENAGSFVDQVGRLLDSVYGDENN